jgi:hypothetical protein
VGGEIACGRVVAIPVAVVAIASDAMGDDCTTIDAGSHAVVPGSVPVGRMDVNGVSVAAADTPGKVAVAESVASPVVKASPTDVVGVAVSPVSVITAWDPTDVGAAMLVLLSEVVTPPPPRTLTVLLGELGGEVITIGVELEAAPVGAAEKLIPEVTEIIGNVAESVAEFKTLAIDESIARSLDVAAAEIMASVVVGAAAETMVSVVVGAELARADVTASLMSLMRDERTLGEDVAAAAALVPGPVMPSVVGAAGSTAEELDVGAAIIEDTTEETSDTILDRSESTGGIIGVGAELGAELGVELGAAAEAVVSAEVAAESVATGDELVEAAVEAVMTPFGPNVMGVSEEVAAAPEVSSVLGVVVAAD